MADDTHPMDDADVAPPPAHTDFQPAEPLKDAGVSFEPDVDVPNAEAELIEAPAATRQALRDGAGKLGGQATDRVRQFAEDGKTRAGDALDQLTQLLKDAADQVDAKIGHQYGDYARSAADTVQSLSGAVRTKNLDELVSDARVMVRKSPGIAIGAAAAVGFVVSRLVQSGIDADRA